MAWTLRRGSKYGAVRQEYNGRWYHSKKEAGYARDLDFRLKAGEITEVVPQFRLRLEVNQIHICDYLVDFKITLRDTSEELHEVKGLEDYIWKLKWKLTEALYSPRYKLVVIK